MSKKIQITLNPKTGKYELEVQGVVGTSCEEITAVLTRGQQVEDSQYTEDYFVPSETPVFVEDL